MLFMFDQHEVAYYITWEIRIGLCDIKLSTVLSDISNITSVVYYADQLSLFIVIITLQKQQSYNCDARCSAQCSGVTRGGADRPGSHPPGVTPEGKNIFVGKFTKNSGETRSDR